MTHAPSDGQRRAPHRRPVKVGIGRRLEHHVYVTETEPPSRAASAAVVISFLPQI